FAGWLSQPIQFRPWVYPPSYLLAMLPFGALPFVAAYAVFQLLTAGLLAAALCLAGKRAHSPVLLVAAALLGPAAAINAGMGQIGAILAAIGLVYAAFRLPLSGDRRIAVLLAATILAAPHSSLADTVLLATAAALWSAEAAANRASLAGWVLPLALWLAPIYN